MKVPRWTPATPAAIAARRAWAKAMVAPINDRTTDASSNPVTDWPTYGTPRWAAMSDDDPRKLAAAVIAAECWATDLDDLPHRVRRELDALHQAEERRWAEQFEHAKKIARAAASPAAFTLRAHYAKTQAERIVDARRPRPGDHSNDQHRNAVQDGEAAA